jgi:hypothetical protein
LNGTAYPQGIVSHLQANQSVLARNDIFSAIIDPTQINSPIYHHSKLAIKCAPIYNRGNCVISECKRLISPAAEICQQDGWPVQKEMNPAQ